MKKTTIIVSVVLLGIFGALVFLEKPMPQELVSDYLKDTLSLEKVELTTVRYDGKKKTLSGIYGAEYNGESEYSAFTCFLSEDRRSIVTCKF